MKAIKITTADGKSITAGHEGADWVAVDYRLYPKEKISRYNVYAVVLESYSLLYHEWTHWEQSSPVLKLETIETETVDSPLSTHRDEGQGEPICSFCGMSQDEVKKLISGPSVYICDGCIQLCNEILENEMGMYKNLVAHVFRIAFRKALALILRLPPYASVRTLVRGRTSTPKR